jgi:LuxR family maltose regulon positive regulatory protein
LGVLDDLCALADRRRLPRLRVHAMAEQMRIHAMHEPHRDHRQLVQALDALAPTFREAPLRWYQPQYRSWPSPRPMASSPATTSTRPRHNWAWPMHSLGELRRGHDMLTTKLLRAVVARQRDADHALPLLAETLSLAHLSGNAHVFANAPSRPRT